MAAEGAQVKAYERRMAEDLRTIEAQVEWIAEAARTAVLRAAAALETDDKEELYKLILDDLPINRRVRHTDALCHAFVARHLPAAGPLREVSSVLRMNIALERIGDYAVTMARIGVKLQRPVDPPLLADLRRIADLSTDMLERATKAFLNKDERLAEETKSVADKVDRLHHEVFQRVVNGEAEGQLALAVAELNILHQLERVSDQAKNICEEAVFAASGQTKPPKVYKVLFVDRTHAFWSQLAQALATKAFPESGRYTSAGTEPASYIDPALTEVAGALGLDLGHARPRALPPLVLNPAEYHVVVAIGEVGDLPEMPFKTVLLRWPAPKETAASAVARELSESIRELMETLRGQDAN